MELTGKNPSKNIVRAICGIAIIAMILVSILVYKASLASLSIFVAFFLFYVQLPGLFILDFFKVRFEHTSSRLAISMFAGWAISILMYFITDVIKTNVLLYAYGPLLSIAFIVFVRKNKLNSIKTTRRQYQLSVALCIFAVLTLLFTLLKTQYVYLAPDYCDYIYMNSDKAYHMGLINSLAIDYPLQSPWIQGRFIYYHIFTEVLYSIPVRLFGITSDVVLSSCGPLMTAYAFILTVYAFFKEMSSRKERAGIYCLLLLLSNIFIVRNATSSIALLFALKNENAAGYGVVAAMATAIMFKQWYENHNAKTLSGSFLILLLITMLTTGIKGPSGAVMIAAIWGTYILGLILRKVKPQLIVPILILTAGFALVYVTVLGSKGQSNSSGDSMFALATISNISFWKAPLVAWLKAHAIPYSIRLLVILAVFAVFLFTTYLLPFCIGYIRELVLVLSGKKDFVFSKIIIYAASLVGLVAMMILNYSGHSQIYFGLVSVFFAPLIAYWLFEDLEDMHRNGRSSGMLLKSLAIIFCVTLVFTSISLGANYVANCGEAIKHANTSQKYSKYKSISNDEYDAMTWIEDNTPIDSLIATDRYYSVPLNKYSYKNRWDNRFFLYAVYSQRNCYIAGSGYNLGANEWPIRKEMIETNSKLYDVDNTKRGDLARELGVNYVVVSKRFTDIPDLSNQDYSICYSNEDVDIYKIKTAS